MPALTDITHDEALEAGGQIWTGNSGAERYYLNIAEAELGLDAQRYSSGGIASATLDGERISNSDATAIVRALSDVRLWIENGRLRERHYALHGRAQRAAGWVAEECLRAGERRIAQARQDLAAPGEAR
jgi:hypothetical protein